jgi:hypothetical protein
MTWKSRHSNATVSVAQPSPIKRAWWAEDGGELVGSTLRHVLSIGEITNCAVGD